MYFDRVSWEVEWIDNRYSWDGIYKWEESFVYDRFSDTSEHIKKTYKEGLDLEEWSFDNDYDKERRINAIIERSKYYYYNWDELGKEIELPVMEDIDDFSFDFSDEFDEE